jgi:hypothetical protein
MTNLQRYESDLGRLVKQGRELIQSFGKKDVASRGKFMLEYQEWYSEAHVVVKQLLPTRLSDFEAYYKQDNRRDLDYGTYTVGDYLIGLAVTRAGQPVFDNQSAASRKFTQQVLILQSAEQRLRSSLFDIKQLVQSDLFDSEIDAARELAKRGFQRAAGAVAGVLLEKHLGQVCENHGSVLNKKSPTIGDFNDALKDSGVIDIPQWRRIQHLADVRNLCDHNKDREPTKDEVNGLLDRVTETIKNLF